MMRKNPIPTTNATDQTFWKDDLVILTISMDKFKWIIPFYKYSVLFFLGWVYLFLFFVFYNISKYPTIIFFIFLLVLVGFSFIQRRAYKIKSQRLQLEIAQIQQRAYGKTGASLIGSAIHVAGNPHLGREQNIVLALTESSLDIYPFDAGVPLDAIPIRNIKAVHTVVYDDERTPHLDVVDTTAQALQLSIQHGDVIYDCLFRRMRNSRPIDWYHALQQTRLQHASL